MNTTTSKMDLHPRGKEMKLEELTRRRNEVQKLYEMEIHPHGGNRPSYISKCGKNTLTITMC